MQGAHLRGAGGSSGDGGGWSTGHRQGVQGRELVGCSGADCAICWQRAAADAWRGLPGLPAQARLHGGQAGCRHRVPTVMRSCKRGFAQRICPALAAGSNEAPAGPCPAVLLAHCRGRRDQGLSRSSTERLLCTTSEQSSVLLTLHTTSLPDPQGQQCCILSRWGWPLRPGTRLQAAATWGAADAAAARQLAAPFHPASLPGCHGGWAARGTAGATSRRPLLPRAHPRQPEPASATPSCRLFIPTTPVMSTPESNGRGAPPATAPMAVPTPAAPPSDGVAATAGATPGRSPRPSGLPPPSPAPGSLPRGSGRRSMDAGNSRRSTDGGRRSIDGGRRGRHTVEVPEGAERHEGLVVSRQEKVRCWSSFWSAAAVL